MSGEAETTLPGVRERVAGRFCTLCLPRRGCSISTASFRCLICSSSNICLTSRIGPHGTPALLRMSTHSALVLVTVAFSSSALQASRFFERSRGVLKRGSSTRCLTSRASHSRRYMCWPEAGHGNADTHRTLAGQAGDGHQAAQPLRDLVVAGTVTVRTALAEARDARVDDARVDRAERLVVDAEPVLDVGTEVLDHHVGLGGQLLEDLDPLGVLEVERDRALVAMEVLEVEVVPREVFLLA